jgi:aryl-alcohol dehydrogenase-like predicted oxidoreductase
MTSAPIKSRKLGKTGIELGELTMGTWGLCAESYGKVFPEQRERTLVRAIEQGIQSFDMAPSWGKDGASEREVAAAVGAASSQRDQLVYITRAGQQAGEHGFVPAFSRSELEQSCHDSLTRLETDRIDIWLLHQPLESHLRSEEVQATCEALKQSGKVRAWGASVTRLDEAQAAMQAGADVLCLPFSMLRQQPFMELSVECSARGVGMLAYSVLSYGALSGRWSNKKKFLADDQRSNRWSPEALNERVTQVSELRFLVKGPVLSLASAAVRFVLAHEVVSSAIIGARTPGQVEAAVQGLVGIAPPNEPYLPEGDLLQVKRKFG